MREFKLRENNIMVQEQLLAIINAYNSDSYYGYGNIPPKKLQAAVQHYPVDLDETPLALIDSTVFGSAKTGMVIGLKGIYWKNSWNVKTSRNFLSWDELANSNTKISRTTYDVQLFPGCEFGMSGSSMNKDLLVNLLNQIISLYKKIGHSAAENTHHEQSKSNSDSSRDIPLLISNSPNDSTDLYSELVPEIIALCMTADGEVEDSEVEIATAIIEHDEFIQDKQRALDSLLANIENMLSNKQKSNAIFKLKSTTIASKIYKISNDIQKERLNVILDGMRDSVSDSGASETTSMIEFVRGKLYYG